MCSFLSYDVEVKGLLTSIPDGFAQSAPTYCPLVFPLNGLTVVPGSLALQ